jgi:hypothetical protein
MYRCTAFRIVVFFALVAFSGVGLASAGHVHTGTSAAAVKSDCQLCTVAHARFNVAAGAPALFGLALLAWLTPQAPAAVALLQSRAHPPTRAPPSR